MKTQIALYALLLGLMCSVTVQADVTPSETLDALYSAGDSGDLDGFLSLLTVNAVFIGLDGTGRLQGQPLRAFISETFSRGSPWKYHSSNRETTVSNDGTVAWFDESIDHDPLGMGKGSGVLVKSIEGWQVAQYNISVPTAYTPSKAVDVPLPEGKVEQDSATSEVALDQEGVKEEASAEETKKSTRCTRMRHKTNRVSNC
jgi:hypothetical protein